MLYMGCGIILDGSKRPGAEFILDSSFVNIYYASCGYKREIPFRPDLRIHPVSEAKELSSTSAEDSFMMVIILEDDYVRKMKESERKLLEDEWDRKHKKVVEKYEEDHQKLKEERDDLALKLSAANATSRLYRTLLHHNISVFSAS
ncbi:hypothetical protein ACH5RR_004580 [Cinchona calisaya]|uniref:Uncharacterized protein n=1 Tax=Cinchona calisaya TaxID=153742 RepID=A0ABD3AYS7_9GENT